MKRLWMIFLFFVVVAGTRAQPAPIDILFWHHYADDTRLAFWEAQAARFNASQDAVRVTVQVYPSYFNLQAALLARLTTPESPPDVAFAQPTDAALYDLSGAVVDLSSYVAQDGLAASGLWSGDEPYLGLPLTRAAASMYVNVDALRALGYDAPPRTWDDLQAMSCAAAPGFDLPLDAASILSLAGATAVYNPQEGYDFAALGPLFERLPSLCANLVTDPANAAQNRFAAGDTLFFFGSSAARPFVEQAIGTYFAQPFDLALAPIPGPSGPVTWLSGPALTLFASSPEREAAAWAWMRWLAAPERVEVWAAVNAAWPVREDVAADAWGDFAQARRAQVPSEPGYTLVQDEIVFALLDVWGGQIPAARVTVLTETANRIAASLEPVIE